MSENAAAQQTMPRADELVTVAHAVKVRGIKGELVATIATDFPERFELIETLYAVVTDGTIVEAFALENFWFHDKRVVLKFAGYDTPETARELVGLNFAVPEYETVELEEDEYYDWELAGCRVETVAGEYLGVVKEVLHTGGTEVLLIDNPERGRDYLLPFATTICVEVDIEAHLIRVDPPEGILDF